MNIKIDIAYIMFVLREEAANRYTWSLYINICKNKNVDIKVTSTAASRSPTFT